MLDPISLIGMGSSLIGGVASMFGASKAADRAKEQIDKVSMFNRNQQAGWDEKMAQMMAFQKAAPTYQADTTAYQAMADKASMNEVQASGATRSALDQFALDQADQGYANLIQATGKLGGSRADMAASLLMGQQNVGAQKGRIISEGQQQMLQDQRQARMANLSSLGQLAAGKAMEGYRAYASQAANQQGMLGLMGQDLSGKMALNQQGFQSEMQANAIYNKAQDDLWQGGANLFGTIGGALNQIGMQNMKMKNLGLMSQNPATKDWAKAQGMEMMGS